MFKVNKSVIKIATALFEDLKVAPFVHMKNPNHKRVSRFNGNIKIEFVSSGSCSVPYANILVGDYDIGYNWTYSDIIFILIVGTEGFIGAWISQFASLY